MSAIGDFQSRLLHDLDRHFAVLEREHDTFSRLAVLIANADTLKHGPKTFEDCIKAAKYAVDFAKQERKQS